MVKLFGFDVRAPKPALMAMCVSGLLTFGLLQGFLQELLFEYSGWSFGWFMTFVQMQTFVAMATAQLAAWNRLQELKAIPFSNYVALSLPLAASQGCGQAALSFVNFPTKVIFKSAKLIPTMMMGIVLIRRR